MTQKLAVFRENLKKHVCNLTNTEQQAGRRWRVVGNTRGTFSSQIFPSGTVKLKTELKKRGSIGLKFIRCTQTQLQINANVAVWRLHEQKTASRQQHVCYSSNASQLIFILLHCPLVAKNN